VLRRLHTGRQLRCSRHAHLRLLRGPRRHNSQIVWAPGCLGVTRVIGNVTYSNRVYGKQALYDGGLQRLHSADDVAINRLEGTAIKALVK